MSGSNLRLAAMLAAAFLAGPRGARSAPAIVTADAAPAPVALRTERILDRETLSGLGLARPSRLAYDDEGCLYVLDARSRRVAKLDPSGRPLHDLGGYGSDDASFSLPSDLAVDRRRTLLVLDRGRGSVAAFDPSGAFLGSRPFAPDLAREAFEAGARLLVDPMEDLWILSPAERDLIPLTERLDRARASRFLSPEDSLGSLEAARFLPNGDVWAYDAGSARLRHFAASGKLIGSAAPADSRFAEAPVDLAVDAAGFLFAADAGRHRVVVFESDGTPCLDRTLGGASRPWRPAAIAVSRTDRVAVADPDRGEIQILAIERGRVP